MNIPVVFSLEQLTAQSMLRLQYSPLMRRSLSQFCLIACLLSAAVFTALAEPANVLVGNLTFTRPKDWRWEEPPKDSSALSRFVVYTPSGYATKTDVRFYIVKKELEWGRNSLLGQFPGTTQSDLQEETFTIGKQKIIYFRLEGTYQFHQNRPRLDQVWLGAVIPKGKQQYIYARLLGPKGEAEQYMPQFRRMVETAVREQQVN